MDPKPTTIDPAIQSSAQFYVMNAKGYLVPAKLLIGADGRYVTNPISFQNQNTLRTYGYFDAYGNEFDKSTINPSNALVVPLNYDINQVVQF